MKRSEELIEALSRVCDNAERWIANRGMGGWPKEDDETLKKVRELIEELKAYHA